MTAFVTFPCVTEQYFDSRGCGVCGWCHVDGRCEYVLVSLQADTETAELARKRKELKTQLKKAGSSPVLKGGLRVTFWGLFAMGLTAAVGTFSGA